MCATGFPVLMIAFLGGYVHSLVPNVLSFTDFVRRRFGPVVQIYVSLLMLFNSEYHTSIPRLFPCSPFHALPSIRMCTCCQLAEQKCPVWMQWGLH